MQQINSLRGACLVQGESLAKHLRDEWEPPITETHPKALIHLQSHAADQSVLRLAERLIAGLDEHQRGATLSALAAYAILESWRGWPDLF